MAIEGYGHCSVAMYSKCSTKILREYLLHGTLPEEGETKCQVDKPYFISPGNKAMMEVSIKHKDVLSEDRIWAAQMALSESIRASVLGRKL